MTSRHQLPMAVVLAGVFALAGMIAGCGSEEVDKGFSTRDSAGIQIVESREPLWTAGEEWTLSAAPTTKIGTVAGNPDYQFAGPWGVFRLADGTIVAGDQVSSEIRFYDASGKFLRRSGRRGNGPGEMSQVSDLKRIRGDTIVAYSGPFKVAYFAPDGSYVRTVTMIPPDSVPFIGSLIGFFDDGSFVARNFPNSRRVSATVVPDSAILVRFSPDGTTRRVLGKYPFWLLKLNGDARANHVIFGPYAWFVTHGDRLYSGYPIDFAINVHGADGGLERVIRRKWTPVPVTEAHVQKYKDEFLGVRKEPGMRMAPERVEQMINALNQSPIAAVMPAHSIFYVDRVGNLWVRHYELAGSTYGLGLWPLSTSPVHASVFNPAGRWLGDVALPPNLALHDIGDDYVVGVLTDDDGVEYVGMYKLNKGTR